MLSDQEYHLDAIFNEYWTLILPLHPNLSLMVQSIATATLSRNIYICELE
jgi:hypothetical protein